jgi:hypothetical protein
MAGINIGDRVRVEENDQGVRVGSVGLVQAISLSARTATIDVANHGRATVPLADLSRVRPYTRRADGDEGPRDAPAQINASWLTKEPYFHAGDAAEQLGVSSSQLRQMASHRGVGSCGKQNVGCRYTVRELDVLRHLKEFMDEVGLDLGNAVKVQKWLERKKAARAAGAD